MDTLLRLVIPLLPAQAGEIAESLSPILNLLSSPTQLVWYLYSNPSRILAILGSSGGNLFRALRNLDFTSASGENSALGAILPFLVGAVGLYVAALSLMSTFRTAWAILRRLVRWGTIIAVVVGAFGLLTGRGAGDAQQGAGAGNALGSLMGLLGGNNAGGGGVYQQAFGMARDYALGNNNNYNNDGGGVMSSIWNSLTNNNNDAARREAPISGRTRSSKGKKSNSNAADNKLDVDGLTDMAQRFVKEAFLKENPLSSWLGTAEKSEAEQKRRAKEDAKAAKAKARGW